MERPDPRCPKRMVFGPCGGVRSDATCEVDPDLTCPWADPSDPRPVLPWDGEPSAAGTAPHPTVLTDLSVPPYDLAGLQEILGVLGPVSDAVLVGEHHHRPDFPPTMMAAQCLAAGARPWITLTCRDRNRIVLEQELVGLAAIGADGVLCVTGDARGPGVRPDVTPVFDLDSTRLAGLARACGIDAAVAVAPQAPPRHVRAGALAVKQRAGATLAVANHVATPAVLASFLAEARAAGADLPVIAGVAVYTDERSAAVLQAFPGLALDAEAMAGVLAADDPVAAGVDAAVAEARALLAVPGVVGVNLSGLASSRGWRPAAEIKAEVARRIQHTP